MLWTKLKLIPAGVLVLCVVGFAAAAGDKDKEKKEDKGKVEPASAPLEARLVAKKKAYTLDRGDKTAEEYGQQLADAAKAGRPLPPPAVELSLELRNTSAKEIKIWVGGDATQLLLDLKGPGAVAAAPQIPMTLEFRVPEVITIPAGKSHTLEIRKLSFGRRGISNLAYWTKAGGYTLTATYQTGVSPKPDGAADAGEGFGRVAVTSAPLKLKVTEKK